MADAGAAAATARPGDLRVVPPTGTPRSGRDWEIHRRMQNAIISVSNSHEDAAQIVFLITY